MKQPLIASALLLAACAAPPQAARAPAAPDPEEAAVVAVVDALFDAMRTRDTAAIRRLAHPDLRIFVPGTQNGRAVLRTSGLAEFMSSVAASTRQFNERAFDPEVRIDGPLAAVWTYYEFRLDDEFSHCGIDALHLARGDSGWRITALAYTTRTTGCRSR